MNAFFLWLFSSQGFMPHEHRYLWQPGTLWLNVGSDGRIAAAYFAITASLALSPPVTGQGAAFSQHLFDVRGVISLCGLTHAMEIWTVWNPAYRLGGALTLLTGIVSLETTVTLLRLMPLALQLRSPQSLQREVDARTAELASANAKSQRTVDRAPTRRARTGPSTKNESHALLEPTFRSVGDAVISTDASGSVQFMNTVAEFLTGWTEHEAHGARSRKHFASSTRKPVRQWRAPSQKFYARERSSISPTTPSS